MELEARAVSQVFCLQVAQDSALSDHSSSYSRVSNRLDPAISRGLYVHTYNYMVLYHCAAISWST